MDEVSQAIDDVRLIRRMLYETRRSTGWLWGYFLLWGSLGLIASLASQWQLATGSAELIWLTWTAYMAIGAAGSAAVNVAERRRSRVRTLLARSIEATWFSILIAIALLYASAFILRALPPVLLGALIALFIGSGLLITGAMTDWRPLYAAAALWWAGGTVMMARPEATFWIEALLLLLGLVLPAYFLRRASPGSETIGAAPA